MALLLGAVAAAGCGGDSAESWEPGRPRIDDVEFLQQTPGRPQSLEFSVAFEDSDGDLGLGQVQLFLDGDENGALSMAEIFAKQRPPMPLDTTTGRISLIVELSEPVEAGDDVEVGFLLEDGRGARSNRPTIKLRAVNGTEGAGS